MPDTLLIPCVVHNEGVLQINKGDMGLWFEFKCESQGHIIKVSRKDIPDLIKALQEYWDSGQFGERHEAN